MLGRCGFSACVLHFCEWSLLVCRVSYQARGYRLLMCNVCITALLPSVPEPLVPGMQGRVVSFANTLVIMTSNVGSSVIVKGGGSLGFQLAGNDEEDGGAYSRISSLVREELKVRHQPATSRTAKQPPTAHNSPHGAIVPSSASSVSDSTRKRHFCCFALCAAARYAAACGSELDLRSLAALHRASSDRRCSTAWTRSWCSASSCGPRSALPAHSVSAAQGTCHAENKWSGSLGADPALVVAKPRNCREGLPHSTNAPQLSMTPSWPCRCGRSRTWSSPRRRRGCRSGA